MALGEVQLMHNIGKHKQAQERQDWLQRRLQTIDTRGRSGDVTLDKVRPQPGEVIELTTKDVHYTRMLTETATTGQPGSYLHLAHWNSTGHSIYFFFFNL